ncbi:hypothetical protein CQA53_10225, partial [Helicobacter didelphidarum]
MRFTIQKNEFFELEFKLDNVDIDLHNDIGVLFAIFDDKTTALNFYCKADPSDEYPNIKSQVQDDEKKNLRFYVELDWEEFYLKFDLMQQAATRYLKIFPAVFMIDED